MCIDFSKKCLYNYDSVIVVTRRSLRFNVSASNQNPLKRRYGVSFCLFIRLCSLFISLYVAIMWHFLQKCGDTYNILKNQISIFFRDFFKYIFLTVIKFFFLFSFIPFLKMYNFFLIWFRIM